MSLASSASPITTSVASLLVDDVGMRSILIVLTLPNIDSVDGGILSAHNTDPIGAQVWTAT